MFQRTMYYIGILACIGMIVSCFLPWTYYVNIHETFTGYHVTRFPAGNYYGKAGITLTVFGVIALIFMLLPKLWAKRVNLVVCGFAVAYSVRTFIIFTSALFEGEVEKRVGIYGIVICSILMLVASLFPKLDNSKVSQVPKV